MKKFALNFLQGMTMGLAELAPGVGAQTVAIVWGVYDDFIELLYELTEVAKNVLLYLLRKEPLQFKQKLTAINWRFAVALASGMLITMVLFSQLLDYLLHNYQNQMNALFFGFVLFSATIPFSNIRKLKANLLLTAVISFSASFFLLDSELLNIGDTPLSFLIGGFIGVSAVLFPGISVSFVLLVMGLYQPLIGIIKNFTTLNILYEDIIKLVFFGLGAVTGFAIFIRILKYATERKHDHVMAFLTGLILASLRVLWPFYTLDASGGKDLYLPFFEVMDGHVFQLLGITAITVGVLLILKWKLGSRLSSFS